MKQLHMIVMILGITAVTANAKRYEREPAVPFMKMSKALAIAEEILKKENMSGYHCKEAKNIITNGGECWSFRFILILPTRTYSVSCKVLKRKRRRQFPNPSQSLTP